MDKFTNKLGKIENRKYNDKTKNDIYRFIKENLTIKIEGDKGYINGNADISLDGLEELTDVLYNYVQQEKAKQEVITLEKLKINSAMGHINIKEINEYIDNVNEKYYLNINENENINDLKIKKLGEQLKKIGVGKYKIEKGKHPSLVDTDVISFALNGIEFEIIPVSKDGFSNACYITFKKNNKWDSLTTEDLQKGIEEILYETF